jgi:hypothetical protein
VRPPKKQRPPVSVIMEASGGQVGIMYVTTDSRLSTFAVRLSSSEECDGCSPPETDETHHPDAPREESGFHPPYKDEYWGKWSDVPVCDCQGQEEFEAIEKADMPLLFSALRTESDGLLH